MLSMIPKLTTGPYSASEIKLVKTHYSSHGNRECSRILNRHHRSIEHLAQKLGLRLTQESRNRIATECKAKPFDRFNVDPTQFFSVSTPEVAYFLGIMWADGNVYRSRYCDTVRIGLVSEDIENLISVCKKIGKFGAIKDARRPRERTTLWTNNRPLADFLESMDYRKKTHVSADKIVNHIPEHLRHYWFRGLIDGDGCISFNKGGKYLAVSSHANQDWNYMLDLYSMLGITKAKTSIVKNQLGSSSQIRLSNPEEIVRVGSYIYKGYPEDGIGFFRKWERYKLIYDLVERRRHNKLKTIA